MKLFLVPTMVFVGFIIWKNKSGWFLFAMSLGLSVATEIVVCWGPLLIFNPWFAQNQPCTTPQSQWNSFLSLQWCLLDASYGRIRVVGSFVVPGAVSGHRKSDCWGPLLIFNPSFLNNYG
jgi:hypothetical protein